MLMYNDLISILASRMSEIETMREFGLFRDWKEAPFVNSQHRFNVILTLAQRENNYESDFNNKAL